LYGTVNLDSPDTNVAFTVGIPTTALDSNGNIVWDTATRTLWLHITAASPLQITTTAVNELVKDVRYSFAFNAAGGKPPYTWTAPDRNVTPKGLDLNTSGILTGIPTDSSPSQTIMITVTDNSGASVTQSFSFTMAAQAASAWTGPAIVSVVTTLGTLLCTLATLFFTGRTFTSKTTKEVAKLNQEFKKAKSDNKIEMKERKKRQLTEKSWTYAKGIYQDYYRITMEMYDAVWKASPEYQEGRNPKIDGRFDLDESVNNLERAVGEIVRGRGLDSNTITNTKGFMDQTVAVIRKNSEKAREVLVHQKNAVDAMLREMKAEIEDLEKALAENVDVEVKKKLKMQKERFEAARGDALIQKKQVDKKFKEVDERLRREDPTATEFLGE
jgi:hypothetical protein